MCNTLEEYLQKVEKEAKKRSSMEIAARILASGLMSEEQIAAATGLSIEEVRELAETMSTPVK